MSISTTPGTARQQAMNGSTHLQQFRLFRIYNHYRVLISLLLVGLLFMDPIAPETQLRWENHYQAVVVSYLAINAFVGMLMMAGFRPRAGHVNASILLDIAMLHLLLVTSTGITNGVANLIIITVAAGNILNPTRMGTFFAALAAIFSLSISGWAVLALDDTADAIVRSGTLGILYFATAFVLQSISRRMIRSEALATSRAKSISELQQINRQIIQRMRTGIVVVDQDGIVRLANAAAEELLFGSRRDRPNHTALERSLPLTIQEGLTAWRRDPNQRIEPFQATPTSPLLQVTFTQLDQEQGDQTLVFIEDLSKITQQAQQMKLASLGRLTASIAHEIRNPLGAISHAAQLMEESPGLDQGDHQMLAIIHRHTRRVNGIIENVLDLSRRRMANTERVEICNWLEDFCEDFRKTHPDGSELLIERCNSIKVPAARFDKSQIEQVLVNLCDNGLRYSKQQTGEKRIQLSVGATGDGERAYIDVQDFGPGIAPENRNSVFEPFFTTEHTGNGLGLYLARELCESNQAHLSLLDRPAPGCCFRITFAPPGRTI